MGNIVGLISIGFILMICFLVLYFLGTALAVIGSIVMSPLFWGIVVVIFAIRYFRRKNG